MAIHYADVATFRTALSGDRCAQQTVAEALDEDVRAAGVRRAGDADLGNDVAQRCWELFLTRTLASFDTSGVSPGVYMDMLMKMALRDVRASLAPAGTRTRPYRDESGEWLPQAGISLEEATTRSGPLTKTMTASYPENLDVDKVPARTDGEAFLREVLAGFGPDVADAVALLAEGYPKSAAAATANLSRFQLDRRLLALRDSDAMALLNAA